MIVTEETKYSGEHILYVMVQWPSGLRRLTQVQVSSEAWVQIPLEPFLFFYLKLEKIFFSRNYTSTKFSSLANNFVNEIISKKKTLHGKIKISNIKSLIQKMTDKGFEPLPPERLVPKTSALDHSANQSLLLYDILTNLKLLMGD